MRHVRAGDGSGWDPKRVGAVVASAVLAAVATGAALGSTGESADAAANVISAARLALADQTASLTTTGWTRSDADTVRYSMTGSIDFTHHADELHGSAFDNGNQVDLGVTLVSGVVYQQVPRVAQLDPGKVWVSADLASLESQTRGSSSGGPVGDPTLWLTLLARQGNAVSSAGMTKVGGTPVHEYSVAFDPTAILRDAVFAGTTPVSAASAVVTSASSDVDVDALGHLVALRLAIDETVGNHVTTVRTSFGYANFGVAVAISAPPAGQVVPLQIYLAMAQSGVKTVVLRQPAASDGAQR